MEMVRISTNEGGEKGFAGLSEGDGGNEGSVYVCVWKKGVGGGGLAQNCKTGSTKKIIKNRS